MICKIVCRVFDEDSLYAEMFGTSGDTKPTEGLVTGSKFTEVDTGIIYLFDEWAGEWFAQNSGNGKTLLTGATVTLGANPAYDGTEKTQGVTSVVLGTDTLTANTDYVVKGNTGVDVGNYVLKIVGIGSYTGVIEKAWQIGKGSGSVSASPDSLSLTAGGDNGTSTLTVVGDGAISVASSAKAVATASEAGNTVTVVPVSEGSATITVTLAAGEKYNGATDTISVTVAAASEEGNDG